MRAVASYTLRRMPRHHEPFGKIDGIEQHCSEQPEDDYGDKHARGLKHALRQENDLAEPGVARDELPDNRAD